jgi:hypothetical protein
MHVQQLRTAWRATRRQALACVLLGAALIAGCSDANPSAQNLACTGGPDGMPPNPLYLSLMQDQLTNADYWEAEPRILAAGLGFTDIIGVPGLDSSDLDTQKASTLAAGGAWNIVVTTMTTIAQRAYTSAISPTGVATGYGWPVQFCDGLPIEFSWPVLPTTVQASDFVVHLNDGSAVQPLVASILPNFEYNERSTVVIFGGFGNRLAPDQPGALYPVSFEIVDDGSPLKLVGPGGRVVSAVGFTYGTGDDPYTGYNPGKGPTLCAAKLSRMSTAGEGGPQAFDAQMPNDGVTLYGDAAQYRLRVLTTGGFSPDGVTSVFPTEYERYFRVQAIDAAGREHWLERTGVPYEIDGGTVTVVGLADLGLAQSSYDDGYVEDHDNQIDIVLSGDESAVRAIRMVEIPASDGYSPFYNPGGPGNDPDPETVYSQPGPLTQQPVTIALDDPMTVTYPPAD